MLRRISILLTVMASVFAALAAKPSDPYAKPDFAFPAKVSANAKEMFDKALATDNGPGSTSTYEPVGIPYRHQRRQRIGSARQLPQSGEIAVVTIRQSSCQPAHSKNILFVIPA